MKKIFIYGRWRSKKEKWDFFCCCFDSLFLIRDLPKTSLYKIRVQSGCLVCFTLRPSAVVWPKTAKNRSSKDSIGYKRTEIERTDKHWEIESTRTTLTAGDFKEIGGPRWLKSRCRLKVMGLGLPENGEKQKLEGY